MIRVEITGNLFLVPLLILLSSCTRDDHFSDQKCAQAIVDDMSLPHQGKLHGTEGMNWGDACCPSIDPGGVPRKNNNGEWFEAITCWGAVYIPREGSKATNTRCQIRNMVTKILRKDGTWVKVQSGDPSGAAYLENFADNSSIDAGARNESGNGGGLSVIVGIGPWAGYNYHFWATPRAKIDVNNIVAVFTSCEARLIIDDPNKPDDRSICKNLLNMGGDWWLDLSNGWLPDWSANNGIGSGRIKWVTSEWQTFSMCTLTPDKILINPPCGK